MHGLIRFAIFLLAALDSGNAQSPASAPTAHISSPPAKSPKRTPAVSPPPFSPQAPSKSPISSQPPTATPAVSTPPFSPQAPSESPISSQPPTATPALGTPPTASPSKSTPVISPATSPASHSPATTPEKSPATMPPATSPVSKSPATTPTKSPVITSPVTSPTTAPPVTAPAKSPPTREIAPSVAPANSPATMPPVTSPATTPPVTAPGISPATQVISPSIAPGVSPSSGAQSPTMSPVISVVGMAGVGKTTLVTKAYDSPQVKNHINCHALITVSQSYKFDELLRSLIKELYKSCNELIPYAALGEMNTSDLVEMVFDYLQKKERYVIILDDVWESTVWEDILVAFPNNRCGGRIIITTRNENVLSSSFGVENVLRVGPLQNEDAFVLFCKKAFGNNECPWKLNPYVKRLVQKCAGLPLALVAIGRLMSRKEKSSLEWKKVEANLSWQLRNNKELERLKNILLLSFNDLPHNLKCCFLYCSLFPEDYTIPQKRLIRLWVAEGFIEKHGRLTLEDVAAEYIKELTCRSLLQIEDHESVRICLRMHDVFRELALEIAREEKFCDAHVAKEEIQSNEPRRLSFHYFTGSIQSSSCHLRSLILFSTEIPSLSLNSIAPGIKLLRVLDLQDSSICSVPDELVELFNLRYLNLRNTNVKKLPESIGRLQNLQTLDIRDSKINTLPKGVEKLKKLRHLYTYHYTNVDCFDFYDFAQAPTRICDLKCLQTLQCIGANNEIVKEVGNLTQLRKLTIRDVKSFHGEELCASLQKLESLLMLQVKATREEEMLHLDNLFHPPIHLETLMLSGRLEKLPPWITSLQDLTKVTLHWSRLNEDPFTFLQALHNLVNIRLVYAYVGKELCIRRGSFLKLKSLMFAKLPRLERILIEEESLSCIRNLNFFDCPELKNIPEGIQYLTSLQELRLGEMSGELLRCVNLQHIPETSRSFYGRDFKVLSMGFKKEDEVKA